MDSEKLLDTRGANTPDTSGVQTGSVSESVSIRDIRGQNSGETKQVPCSATAPAAHALDSGRSSLDSPRIFVLSLAPMARWWEGARERNGTIREINGALAANSDSEGYVFVDLHPVLADENGFLRGDMTSDGVHLSAKGYEAVLEKMKNGPLRGR